MDALSIFFFFQFICFYVEFISPDFLSLLIRHYSIQTSFQLMKLQNFFVQIFCFIQAIMLIYRYSFLFSVLQNYCDLIPLSEYYIILKIFIKHINYGLYFYMYSQLQIKIDQAKVDLNGKNFQLFLLPFRNNVVKFKYLQLYHKPYQC